MNAKNVVKYGLVVFIVYIIYELIRKILGGSLSYEEIVIGLLIANLGYSFQISTQLSEHLGWHKGKNDLKS